MSLKTFIEYQLLQIQQGGRGVLFRKTKLTLPMLPKLPWYCFLSILATPVVLVIRLMRPWLLVRWGGLVSSRIGHFAANTELYFCEQDAGINVPKQRYVDLFYMTYRPICNQQLATMWKRALRVWSFWILFPISWVNRVIPGGAVHEIGNNTQHDRDVNNLLGRFPPHLKFTPEEEARGEVDMRAMGIPKKAPYVCLIVRDSAYLDTHRSGRNWRYHDYRDSDIQNYILAAEELADRGFFVLRMGAKARETMKSDHPRIIDYAMNGMRSDFMDIYLGAKCAFCISVGTGFDAIPYVFRRPVAYVNMVPLGYLGTFWYQSLCIIKHYVTATENRYLALRDIVNQGAAFWPYTSDYDSNGIKLIENTPEEIRDIAIEMAERLNGTWQPHEDDEVLQRRFWVIFPTDAVDANNGRPLHGEIRARFGAHFLRNNRDWLQ